MLLIYAITILFNIGPYAADENQSKQSKTTDNIKKKASGPYCGLNCLYTIMKLDGREVDFEDLIKPKYIGSYYGSSLNELKEAAEDYGLCAIIASKLTSKELSQSDYFFILHVKFEVESEQYDHYELLLGTENDQARIFDPPNPVRLVSFADLAPRWDGNGLIVSAEPIDLGAVFAPARKRFVLFATIVIAIILALHWAKRFLPKTLLNTRIRFMGLSIAQTAGFVIAAILIGMFYHFTNNAGLLANATATTSIQKAHQGNFIPKVTEKKVHKLLDTDTVFIDARYARDYEAGHLEGAISVPVDANDIERKKVTADIAKNARIVMYCQSSGCKYAEIVAIKLIDDGYSNISIYKGGWAEWKEKNGKKRETSS